METCSKMVFLLSSDYYSGVGFLVGFLGGQGCDLCCYFEKITFEGAFIHSQSLTVSCKYRCLFSYPSK